MMMLFLARVNENKASLYF